MSASARKASASAFVTRPNRQVQVAGHPREPAVDAFVAHVLVDRAERSQPGVPHGAGMVASEVVRPDVVRRVSVTHVRCAEVCAVSLFEQPPAFQQGDALAAL